MNLQELEALIKKYNDNIEKTGVERQLNDTEIDEITKCLNSTPGKYQTTLNEIENKNFGNFEALDPLMRNYFGALEMRKFIDKFGKNPSVNDPEVRDYLNENLMNAAFRVGISADKTSKDQTKRDNAKSLDTFMNARLMQNTMMPPSEEQKTELIGSIGNDAATAALEQDLKRQRVLAKTYFLAQLGKYDVLDDNGVSIAFNVPLSETIAHGSRTNFILPQGTDTKQVIDAYVGAKDGNAQVVEERTAATHYVKRRALDKNGLIKSETKESRTYNPLKVFGHQYGMNISAGGIGSKGPDGNVISGNGENGHAYMRIQEGDEKHCGSLLFGIEGSAPGKNGPLGHSHGMSGGSANQSVFLADKRIVGKKNGGRQVDLSGIDAKDLADLLNDFDKKYSDLQKGANTPKGRAKLAELNDKLMGAHMDRYELTDMCTNLGIGGEKVYGTVYDGHYGYLAKVKSYNMDKHAFCQNIRATVSQEMACDLAEKRFNSSDDLSLSVGAVKELICTHEARGFLWRLRHPILNYRENATIKDLTKRLEEEKGFYPEDIAIAFNSPHNTFSMNWGKGLSNDRFTCRYLEEKSGDFIGASTLGPVINATKKLVNKFYKSVYSTQALQERMKREVKQMQAEIDNDDMTFKEEELFKRDREYRNRDDFDDEPEEEKTVKEEDPAEEFRKTSPRYAAKREEIHIDILNNFYNDFEKPKSPKVEETKKKDKEYTKNL